MKNFTLLILIVILLGSCTSYHTVIKKNSVNNKGHFRMDDTLTITDLLICNAFKEGFGGEIWYLPVNEDSAMVYFKNAISGLNLHVKFLEPLRYDCITFIKNIDTHLQPLSEEQISNLARQNPARYKMIPVIGYLTNDIHSMSFTYSSAAPVSQFNRHLSLSMTIYILENDTVIYSNSMIVSTTTKDVSEDFHGNVLHARTQKPYVIILDQKYWDKLVEKTMKGFIKRMKDDEN